MVPLQLQLCDIPKGSALQSGGQDPVGDRNFISRGRKKQGAVIMESGSGQI